MAMQIYVDGPAKITIGGVDLGYSMDGVQIIEQAFTEDIPGDENGGISGPPIDVQYFGEIHIVRFEMTKWDDAVLAPVRSRLLAGTAGSIGTVGTLYAADSKMFSLGIASTNRSRTYSGAIPREANSHNKGTKFSRQELVFHCYAVAGTLYS